jgi:hypothetical protein
MTVETVKKVATRFLTSEGSGALALKGEWGVGKTYAWNQILQANKAHIKLKNYSYVSLFGATSLSELRTTIFLKMQRVKLEGETRNFETVNNNPLSLGFSFLKSIAHRVKDLPVLKDLPYLKNLSVGLESVAPLLIRNAVICLDDFERLNTANISPEELLGFISELKEEKGCKVVLIFNENKLAAVETYAKFREKVIDIELLFAPTAEEAANLALPEDLPGRDAITGHCVSLNITNIRVLRKIGETVRVLHPAVVALHPRVFEQAMRALVLYAWCYFERSEKKPSLEAVRKLHQSEWASGKKSDTLGYAQWQEVLQDYDWSKSDSFDIAIFNVVERGYLEESGLLEAAQKLDQQFHTDDPNGALSNAWRVVLDTFAGNEDVAVQSVTNAFSECILRVSPSNLNETVLFLRHLRRDAEATELIELYLREREAEAELFGSRATFWPSETIDPDLQRAFDQKFAETHQKPAFADVLRRVVENGGHSKEEAEVLAEATMKDFYESFKRLYGEALTKTVKACLWFDPMYPSVGQNARAALERIAQESPLNAFRVQENYGIRFQAADAEKKEVA